MLRGWSLAADASLEVIDEAMRELTDAEAEFRRLIWANMATVGAVEGPDGVADDLPPGRLAGLEDRLSGRSGGERMLLAVLAFRQVERCGRAERATELAERALASGQLLADGVGSPALVAAGVALGTAGRTQEAERLFGTIIEQAQRTNSRAVLATARGQRGVERYRRGGLYEALRDLEAALSAARGQPWETMIDDGRACLLRVRVERGELIAAERCLHAWCATGPLPDTVLGNGLLIERGRLRLAQGRASEAAIDLRAAAERLASQRESVLFEWRGVAALAQHRLGELEGALALAREDLERMTAWGAPRQLGSAMITLGLIEGGLSGLDLIEQAVELLEGSPAVLERARALVTHGVLLRRAGKARRARSQLNDGLKLANRCGAHALAQLAEQEIGASGERRRRRTLLSGPEALTPTEQRVADLAASGLSNPDIARALFITRKTVEMHLGNTYRKLQINSRHRLRAALNQEPPDGGQATLGSRAWAA